MTDARGETVRMILEQVSPVDGVLSRTTVEWFGLENAFANRMQMDLANSVLGGVKVWDVIKNPVAPQANA